MDVWHLALYVVASFLALRSLLSLMTHHKLQYQQQLMLQESQRKRPASAAKPQPANREKAA